MIATVTCLLGHTPAAGQAVVWSDIEPLVTDRCAMRHQGEFAPLGLHLDSLDGLLAGSDNGPVVVAGEPETSELYRRILGHSRPRMPFDGPPYLSADELEWIRAWIAAGAPDTMGRTAVVPVGAEVRLHGVLSGLWVLDDLPLEVDRSTRIDKKPRPGDYVQVRGRVGANGSVYVERIRPR